MFNLIFFSNDTATTQIYTLSLHDALPISRSARSTGHRAVRRRDGRVRQGGDRGAAGAAAAHAALRRDRKSTRLNSSHITISYAVFCLKKKKKETKICLHKIRSYRELIIY